MSIRNLTSTEIKDIIAEKPRTVLLLYRLITPYLKNWFSTKVADDNDREELIQDAVLSVLDSMPRYKMQSSFSTWVTAIARHELVDYYRRRKIKTILFFGLPVFRRHC